MKEYKDCCIILRGMWSMSSGPTLQNIENVRKVYDGEIIYSTWHDTKFPTQELKRLGVKIVLSDDPGTGPIQNIKRQMFPVRLAIEHTNKDKIFVIRGDVSFTKMPFYLYDENKIYFSSIMSLPMKGLPANSGLASFEASLHTRFDYDWFCRFGDLFHLGNRKEMIKLFSYFTKEQEALFLQTLPRCQEQWMFYKYITEKIGDGKELRSEYDRHVAENIEILNLSDIEGKFTIGIDDHKYDHHYYDKTWHLKYKNKYLEEQ